MRNTEHDLYHSDMIRMVSKAGFLRFSVFVLLLAAAVVQAPAWVSDARFPEPLPDTATDMASPIGFAARTAAGGTPWFDPSIDMGTAFLSVHRRLSPFSPVFWAAALLKTPVLKVFLLVLLAVGGLGVFETCLSSGFSRAAALVGAMVFVMQGVTVSTARQGGLAAMGVISAFPWLLFLISSPEAGFRHKVAGIGAVFSLVVFQGHPEWTGTVLSGVVVWIGAQTMGSRDPKQSSRTIVIPSALGIALGAVLAAVYFIPGFWYGGGDPLVEFVVQPPDQSPSIFHNLLDLSAWMSAPFLVYGEADGTLLSFFCGHISLFLAISALTRNHRNWQSKLVSGSLALILLGLVSNVPDKGLFPGATLLLSTGLAISAASGLDHILDVRSRSVRSFDLMELATLLAGSCIFAIALDREVDQGIADDPQSTLPYVIWLIVSYTLFWSVLKGSRKGILQGKGTRLALALLVMIESTAYGWTSPARVHSFLDTRSLVTENPLTAVPAHDRERARVASFEATSPMEQMHADPARLSAVSVAYAGLVSEKAPPCLCNLAQKTPFPLSWHWIESRTPKQRRTMNGPQELGLYTGGVLDRIFDLLHVKYLITDLDVAGEAFTELFRFDGTSIWQKRNLLPPVRRYVKVVAAKSEEEAISTFLSREFDPAREIVVQADIEGMELGESPGDYGVEVLTNSPGRLIFRVRESKGEFLSTTLVHSVPWDVYMDGKSIVPFKVNGCFLGVYVPPGNHLVAISMNTDPLSVGAAVSTAGLFLVLVLCMTGRQKKD